MAPALCEEKERERRENGFAQAGSGRGELDSNLLDSRVAVEPSSEYSKSDPA